MTARAALIRIGFGFNGFDGILDDVRQRLPQLAAVAHHLQVARFRRIFEANVGMGDLVQEQGMARNVADRFAPENGLRHAREGREFIDDAAQVAHLAHDRAGEAAEGRLVARHFLGIAALEPFGGQLDRRQRVLDLMRDAARDIGPGGAALVGQLLGDVVEGQDVARGVARQLDRQRAQIAMGAHLDDARILVRRDEVSKFGRNIRQPPANRIIPLLHQDRRRRTVEQQHNALQIDGEHAGGHARKDRLDEGAAFVELAVGGDERAGLGLEPLGHAVEGGRQRADFVAAERTGDARGQVARGDAPRRRHQLVHRPHHPVGHGQSDIDRDPDQEQRSHEQRDVEAQLQRARLGGEQIIVGDHLLRPLDIGKGGRAGVASGVEIDFGVGIEQRHRLDLIRSRLDHDILAGREATHDIGRKHFGHGAIFGIHGGGGARDAVLPDLDNGGAVELSRHHLIDIALGEARARYLALAEIIAQIAGHGQRFVAHLAQILLIIAARQVACILEHAARAVREPELHAILEQQRCEDHHQQHRHAGDDREDRDEAHMQLPVAADGGGSGAALGHAPAEQHQQRDRRHEIRDQQQRHDRRRQQGVGLAASR